MAIDPAKISLARASGLSFICASCENYWNTQDLGNGETKCSATFCGSPIAGDTFSEYKGPVTNLDKFCFVCGSDATHALRVTSSLRVVGCCNAHVELVKTLRPASLPPVNVVLISKDGARSSEDKETTRSPLLLSNILRS